jgi:hypothetical protein
MLWLWGFLVMIAAATVAPLHSITSATELGRGRLDLSGITPPYDEFG